MNNEIIASVILPVYNGEKYLRQCLDSLLEQDLQEIEFICVNDGSTDSTSDILHEYAAKDARFKVIDKPNGGFGQSMNVGIDAARGEYITSVDADDYISSDAVRLMVELADSNQLDFVKGDRLYFSGDDAQSSDAVRPIGFRDDQYQQVFNSSEDPVYWAVEPGLPGLYRKSFLDECGIRLNETPGASFQDTGLTAQVVFNARRALLLRKPIYNVRRDNAESSSMDKSKVFCICEEHEFIREKARLSRGDVEKCLKAAAVMRIRSYEWNAMRIDPKDCEAFVSRAHQEFIELDKAGELDESCFAPELWTSVQLLVNAPMEYYVQVQYGRVISKGEADAVALKKTREELKRTKEELVRTQSKLNRVTKSVSWRIGRGVTWFPRKVKRVIAVRKRK